MQSGVVSSICDLIKQNQYFQLFRLKQKITIFKQKNVAEKLHVVGRLMHAVGSVSHSRNT